MNLFPTTAVTDVIAGFTDVVTDNMGVVLGVLAFSWGVYFVTARLNNAKKGKI